MVEPQDFRNRIDRALGRLLADRITAEQELSDEEGLVAALMEVSLTKPHVPSTPAQQAATEPTQLEMDDGQSTGNKGQDEGDGEAPQTT